MTKTIIKFISILLSLVLIMSITSFAFAVDTHDECDCTHMGFATVEIQRGIACPFCERGVMFDREIGYGSWTTYYPLTTRYCSYNYLAADVFVQRGVTHQLVCSYCGHAEDPTTAYEYAWYCPINSSYGS